MEEQACTQCCEPKTLGVVCSLYKENNACNLQPLPRSTFRSAWGCLQHVQTLEKNPTSHPRVTWSLWPSPPDLHISAPFLWLPFLTVLFPPLHPCSPSHHLHSPVSDSDPFRLPQYPQRMQGVTPLTSHSCAVPSLMWHRLCSQCHQIKIETEQRASPHSSLISLGFPALKTKHYWSHVPCHDLLS